MRRVLRTTLVALLLVSAACTDQGGSPVGDDLLPDGVLGGGLQVVTIRDFSQVENYEVFPAERGRAPTLFTAHDWPGAGGFESRIVARFLLGALDSLPAGTEIVDADLRLAFGPIPEQPVTIRVHRLLSAWEEAAATWTRRELDTDWATPGGDFDPVPVATFTVGGQPPDSAQADSLVADSVAVPIPVELVEAWRADEATNHGLILVQESPGDQVRFAARDGIFGVTNSLGPSLELQVLLPGAGTPSAVGRILAREDTFLPLDPTGLASPELVVSGAEPLRRIVLVPNLETVPAGATVASAKLVFSLDEARLPADTLTLVAAEVIGEIRGEKTLFGAALGAVALDADSFPFDSIVFESSTLTRRVRDWILAPEGNDGIGILVAEAEQRFGGVSLFGPEAAAALRPRLRLVVVPPASGPTGGAVP